MSELKEQFFDHEITFLSGLENGAILQTKIWQGVQELAWNK